MKPERGVDKWNQKMVKQVVTVVHNHCDLVIAPSPKIEQQLRAWHTDSPLTVLPNGVDEIVTTEALISADRARYNLRPDDEVVLSVGRMGTEENLELLVRAFARVAVERPQAKLVIVGDGPDRTRLTAHAAAVGLTDRIIFTGRTERHHLGALYALARIFAFPSLTDVNPLVLNEAALAGTPLVACDRLISDLLVDGRTSLLADPDKEAFAAQLTWLLQHPTEAAAMGEAARQVARGDGAAAQAEKLVLLYEQAREHHGRLHARH